MIQYEHLPIYKKAMELSVYLHNLVHKFSRYNKYTIVTDMRQKTYKIIIQVNSEKIKLPLLKELIIHCEMLKNMLILAKEVKA